MYIYTYIYTFFGMHTIYVCVCVCYTLLYVCLFFNVNKFKTTKDVIE